MIVACSGGGAHERAAAPHAQADAGTPDVSAPDATPAPWACGARDRADCLQEARLSLVESDPTANARGVTILRAFCEEGDERRCFEPDTSTRLRAECARDLLIDACEELAHLYRLGYATCPYDTACAKALEAMVCLGRGGGETCGVPRGTTGP